MDLPPMCADFLHDLLHYPCTYFTKNSHFLQCLQALYDCSASPNHLIGDSTIVSIVFTFLTDHQAHVNLKPAADNIAIFVKIQ